MLAYDRYTLIIVIAGIVVLLNCVLIKKIMNAFPGKRLWLVTVLCSAGTACYLLPYFAMGRIFYIPEIAAGELLFLFCFALIQKTKVADREMERLDTKRILLLLVIPLTGLTVLLSMVLGDLRPYYFSALCCGCVLVADLSVFYLYYMLAQNAIHIRQRDVYRQQTDHYRNQLEVIEESQTRIRALRHDIKNHLLHLNMELQQGHFEAALDYLKDMEEEAENPVEYVRCGNREIDSLLNYKLEKAKQVLAQVECRVSIPVELMPRSFDINVILGNLLDNAIEAAQGSERKWMKLVMQSEKGVLLINIANSCAEPPRKRGKDFLSTKEEMGEHGIGLLNVRRMVERQNGNVEFAYADGVFTVEVLLYINEM